MSEQLNDRDAKAVEAGHAVYSRRVLSLYDLLVLGISNRFIWRCPTQRLLNFYDRHVTANHLDVGVGTGYFLDRCRFPDPSPRIVLMDLNQNCLEDTARRISRYDPVTCRKNVLEPINWDGELFSSIGLNYVLHCLPGPWDNKVVVFDHLIPLLEEHGTLFGSALLSDGVKRGYLARRLMAFYNRKGIFSNADDSLERLQQALADRFSDFKIDVIGCAAIFYARRPKGTVT